jgi:hypothetical protein
MVLPKFLKHSRLSTKIVTQRLVRSPRAARLPATGRKNKMKHVRSSTGCARRGNRQFALSEFEDTAEVHFFGRATDRAAEQG